MQQLKHHRLDEGRLVPPLDDRQLRDPDFARVPGRLHTRESVEKGRWR